MKDVVCIYYSRTGNTKKAMEEIAQDLDAELVELHDDVDRSGWRGWLRSGLDAMRRTTHPVTAQIQRPLKDYSLVILGTPVWAGRCSCVMRGFLKARGREMKRVAYVVTRSSGGRFEEVYDQMDLYVPVERQFAVSLRSGAVGYEFWREDFLRQAREFLEAEK